MTRSAVDLMNEPEHVPSLISLDVILRISACDISETRPQFSDLVTRRIAETGKHVDDLTVGELRAIVEECSLAYNAMVTS